MYIFILFFDGIVKMDEQFHKCAEAKQNSSDK